MPKSTHKDQVHRKAQNRNLPHIANQICKHCSQGKKPILKDLQTDLSTFHLNQMRAVCYGNKRPVTVAVAFVHLTSDCLQH